MVCLGQEGTYDGSYSPLYSSSDYLIDQNLSAFPSSSVTCSGHARSANKLRWLQVAFVLPKLCTTLTATLKVHELRLL